MGMLGKMKRSKLNNLYVFIVIFYLDLAQSLQYNITPQAQCQLDFCYGSSSEVFNYHDYTLGDFCKASNGFLSGRCCFESNETIGLDLSNCSLNSLHGILTNFTSLQFLDLGNNSLSNCSEGFFLGLVSLNYLYIPESCSDCPGNHTAWNKSVSDECLEEKDPCQYLNVSCTDYGLCKHLGPGSAQCICLPHRYGYKCLREGDFPYGLFLSLLIVSTAILSSVLWYYIGRHAKRD